MKKFVDIIVQTIIVIMLILTIVLPKKEFSENENRYLKTFPIFKIEKILNGKYMTLMTDYIADHFPFRENLLSFKTNTLKLVGVKRQNNVYYADDDYLIEEYSKPVNNEKIINIVNRFINNNPNIKYDFMLVPTSTYILKDKLPKYNLNYDESKTIDYFKNKFLGNFIDVTDILLNHKEEDIYYRTDHHWTTKGAYYGYLKFSMYNNIIPYNYNFKEVSNSFYGTLYSKVIDNNIKPDTIYQAVDNNKYLINYQGNETSSLYNEDYLNKKDKYSYFLNGNQSLITISNLNVTDNEILIIKDSYANSFIPLICRHFSKIHVIDPRYYKGTISNYIKENNINHVLFLYNVKTIDEDLGILSIN